LQPPVYRDTPREEELAQGDILESFEFFRPLKGTYKDVVRLAGAVVSHSCDFTKFRADREKGRDRLDQFPLIVAPVVKASELPDQGTAGNAKAGRVARYFHLPPGPPLDDDYLIDFWFMQPAAVLELLDIPRVASMTDQWQLYLQRGLDRFFSWEERRRPISEET
jgi:hypothetical protein